MVSIVLSTYNSLKYIEAQLESLKSQTYKYFDVIITDDGSTDGTIDYLKSYIASNGLDKWKLYENKENVGYALNFKRGIEKAEGDIIFLCDHDDIWHSNKIEEMVRIFNKKKKASLIGTSFNFIDGDSKPINNDGGLVSLLTSNHKLIKYHIGHNKLKRLSYKQIYTYSFTPGCCMTFRGSYKNDVVESINKAPHDYVISALFSNISFLTSLIPVIPFPKREFEPKAFETDFLIDTTLSTIILVFINDLEVSTRPPSSPAPPFICANKLLRMSAPFVT